MRRVAPQSMMFGLLVAVAACSDSTSPPKPAGVTATSAVTLSATVGTAVAATPTVKVLDAGGAPLSGVAVQFAVSAGGGTLARTSTTTDAAGTANAGLWTLPTAAGTHTVDATVAGLAAVRFTATATAAAPATMTTTAGDAQTANVGDAVTTAPAVLLKDQYGNPVPGTTVTFAIVSGNGSVTGGTAISGNDGIARAGAWAMGIVTGAQQLRATAGTLTANFTATAKVPTGCTVTNYALGATLAMNWDADDCVKTTVGNRRYDRLQFTTTAQQSVETAITGPNGRQLYLRDVAKDLYVGLQPGTGFSPLAQNPMKLKYVLAPGTYQYETLAPDANTTGAYTIATTTGTKVDCDYIVFGSVGVQFTDSVNTNSCIGPTGGREQWINLQLKTGMKFRITLSGSDFVPILVFRDDRLGPASPTLVARVGNTAGETLTIDWTATFDTWHEIVVATKNGVFGKYTLKIEPLP